MSYFAFGLVSVSVEGPAALERATDAMLRWAQAGGFTLHLGGQDEPSIVTEMRGKLTPQRDLPFFCVASAADDTSDALISPFELGVSGAADGVASIAQWIRQVAAEASTRAIQLWLTEGWDDAFEHLTCSNDEIVDVLPRRVREAGDVPSLHATVTAPREPQS